ncbi:MULTISPECIES: SoxS protein [unclassified Paracoccus (in: a-proteobacteria)]|uniref:SoxS protein n=1 Tax=unclassified Paracoccus (in: a-proteobacteria) TaxID=2688777 RepID=UPI0012B2F4EF|nr:MULTISPECIES: SoxS protein [unclassified Paracoccus (in: a-proteobacteria)]UXU75324.1 SoxS protein [Paracoccus sp. SMMA_5]UXU81227.1 SoxS protein [Paracoccus sp. SMMA_5_TC]
MIARRTVLAGLVALSATRAAARGQLRLLMVRRAGCVYCAQWDRQIGPHYASHPLGRQAPLLSVDLDGPYPDGLALARRPWLTPTFILLQDGLEITRVEGYPGADRFFAVLADMLALARG